MEAAVIAKPTPRLTSAHTILTLVQMVGERAMVDLGLGVLLERFERDFGRGWARAISVIAGMGLISACLTLTGNMVGGLIAWIEGTTAESTLWDKTVTIAKYLVGFGLMIVLVRNFAAVAIIRHYEDMSRRFAQETEAQLDRVEAANARYERDVEAFRSIIGRWAETCPDERIAKELRHLQHSLDRSSQQEARR